MMSKTAIATAAAAFLMSAGCTNLGETEEGALSGGAYKGCREEGKC